MLPLPDLCRFVMEIAMKTGAYIKDRQKILTELDIQQKGAHDIVTVVDKKAEEILVDSLRVILPEAGFLTEEKTVSQAVKEYMWVIDPIDGTSNFAHGIPLYSISIALQKNNETIFSDETITNDLKLIINNNSIDFSMNLRNQGKISFGINYDDEIKDKSFLYKNINSINDKIELL